MADLFREITYRLQELRAERFAINREIAQVEEDLQEEVLRNLSLQTKILNSLTTSEILNALRRADSKIQDDFTAKPDWATKKPAPEKVA